LRRGRIRQRWRAAAFADVEAGRVVPHDEAMAEIQDVIDTAKSGKV
jgi:predicted transcriptional regulator